MKPATLQLESATRRTLVVTTINAPNTILRALAQGAQAAGWRFVIAGDTKTPGDFSLPPACYLDVDAQADRFPEFCRLLPLRHYGRKNVAYLDAIRVGAEEIIETDDDNMPISGFFSLDSSPVERDWVTSSTCWCNVYELFSDENVWPRGYPLERLHDQSNLSFERKRSARPIIQGLADGNPDVDAVYRMTRTLPLNFKPGRSFVVGPGTWCPFNSQNTVFKRSAFPLLYLPSFCSFRMTDIWRSFVAQRILWESGEGVEFVSATVVQERNEHSLLRDFADEVPGYLHNATICRTLETLAIDRADTNRSLMRCYEALVGLKVVGAEEIPLLREWLRHFE